MFNDDQSILFDTYKQPIVKNTPSNNTPPKPAAPTDSSPITITGPDAKIPAK